MDERLAYPAAAMRWNINAEHHDYAATVFQAIVTANGFSVLAEQELPDARERLLPDSVTGRPILWSEHAHSRSLVTRWQQIDAIVLISQCPETAEVSVAANDLDAARKIIAEIDKLLPRAPSSGDMALPITFWHQGNENAETTVRQVELACWSDLAGNYAGDTRTRLASLMDGFKPAKNNGRLLLWHGEPGTGKTFAIRALGWAWREWCRFEYVIDPEQLFDRASYLTEVVLNRRSDHDWQEVGDRDKWRLLILEDSGEMMGADAKSQVGQGLSRLLNVSDGILGQGTKIMILVTTNEDLGKLNPAVMRPGRCLSEIESISRPKSPLANKALPSVPNAEWSRAAQKCDEYQFCADELIPIARSWSFQSRGSSIRSVRAFAASSSSNPASRFSSQGLRIQALCPGVVATEFHERQGLDLSAVPRMSADDVVTASLRRLALGEVLCAPGVERSDLLDAVFQADLAAFAAQAPQLAGRYRTP